MDPPFCLNKKHKFDERGMIVSHRYVGSVAIYQCNNCLAIRVEQEWIKDQENIQDFSMPYPYEKAKTIVARKHLR